MKDESSKCTRTIIDLPSQCVNDRSLDVSSYYTQFKFIPVCYFTLISTVFAFLSVQVLTLHWFSID